MVSASVLQPFRSTTASLNAASAAAASSGKSWAIHQASTAPAHSRAHIRPLRHARGLDLFAP